MLIKGSQRGSGTNLAAHLLKTDDNDHVLVHEVRGFASDNLHDAFKEAEAISLGTKCRQYLFSVSINPPQSENVPLEVFEDTVDRIEKRLGLVGQPRAVVFHEKENRLHAHAVWSRVDAETMTAKHMPFFKNKLFALARDLHLEFGFKKRRQRSDQLHASRMATVQTARRRSTLAEEVHSGMLVEFRWSERLSSQLDRTRLLSREGRPAWPCRRRPYR